jgi:hypothetical protein
MTPEEAIAVACDRCVTAASMLAVARLPVDADRRTVGRSLATGVVCGWADHTSTGTADARGISVRERGASAGIQVRWDQVAAALLPSLRQPGIAQRLAEVYGRYVAAANDMSVSGRLSAQVASAELAQLRRRVLERCRSDAPVQQSLFPPPPSRDRSLARPGR